MQAVDILKAVEQAGGRLEACGQRLRLSAPKGTLDVGLLDAIRNHKQGLMALLAANDEPPRAAVWLCRVAGREFPVIDPMAEDEGTFSEQLRARFGERFEGVTRIR